VGGTSGLLFSCGHLGTAFPFELFDVGVGHAERRVVGAGKVAGVDPAGDGGAVYVESFGDLSHG
jgi:hypothetical protein